MKNDSDPDWWSDRYRKNESSHPCVMCGHYRPIVNLGRCRLCDDIMERKMEGKRSGE